MRFATTAILLLTPCSGLAADFNGAQLGIAWGVPFVGILLSIALCPLLVPSFWHHHFGKVSAAWALAFLVPFAAQVWSNRDGAPCRSTRCYSNTPPSSSCLFALYTVAGGICVRGALHGHAGG